MRLVHEDPDRPFRLVRYIAPLLLATVVLCAWNSRGFSLVNSLAWAISPLIMIHGCYWMPPERLAERRRLALRGSSLVGFAFALLWGLPLWMAPEAGLLVVGILVAIGRGMFGGAVSYLLALLTALAADWILGRVRCFED